MDSLIKYKGSLRTFCRSCRGSVSGGELGSEDIFPQVMTFCLVLTISNV